MIARDAMSLDPAALCLRINGVFGRMPYPGDEHIVYDNSGAHLECEEIKSALKGRHWRDVSFETLDELRSALSFLSPAGYRFYLPAFMVLSIVDFQRADVIPDVVIRSLTLPRASDVDRIRELAELHPEMQPFSPDEWEGLLQTMAESYRSGTPEHAFFQRVSGFDLPQCRVIRQYLEYMRDAYGGEFPNRGPEIALERYWDRF
jgi:uncharacterized protein DUF6714